MKMRYLFAVTIFSLLCMFSCSQEDEGQLMPVINAEDGVPVSVDMGAKSLPNSLQCKMYIFWKLNGATDYKFKDSADLLNSTNNRVKFMNEDLTDQSYRFLFVATPTAENEINILTSGGNSLVTDDIWDDVIVRAIKPLMTSDNYYKVLDLSSEQILRNGRIEATLTRMVGQMIVDIYKVSGDDVNSITGVSSEVASVLDRVYKIDILSKGLTRDAYFDVSTPDTVIVRGLSAWGADYTDSITGITMSDSLRVSVPNAHQRFEILPYENVDKTGGVRIRGTYGLPSAEGMRYKLTFHYYDTTPVCGDTTKLHNHYDDVDHCFAKNNIELNLPKEVNPANLLSIFANYYTVNKAGIKFDRIIDLDINAGFGFDFVWENEK